MASPYIVKWGILATGGIATTFAKDLLVDPSLRGVTDVQHKVAAAASSSSKERAAAFLKDIGAGPEAKAYGSYAELVQDPDVDVIYVATPHSHHFQNAMLAIEVGHKPVLCEKPFTLTAAQTRKIVAAARAQNLFLMEAVWTRYFPLSVQIRDLVSKGTIGTVYRVVADNSLNCNSDDVDAAAKGLLSFPNTNRMVNLDLAGGAMLDLGIYSFTWLFQILYHLQKDGEKESPLVVAASNKYAPTGADEQTTAIVQFPRHNTMGVALTGLRFQTGVTMADGVQPAGPAILIQGSQGEIQVDGPAFRPQRYVVITRDPKTGAVASRRVVDSPIPQDPHPDVAWKGHGMFYEADEVARCLRDGKKESATLPLDESIVIMEAMEEVLKQGGLKYPEAITSDQYSKDSPLNLGKA